MVPDLWDNLAGADVHFRHVIWATSYAFDFSLVKLPVLDKDGFPIRQAASPPIPVSTLNQRGATVTT